MSRRLTNLLLLLLVVLLAASGLLGWALPGGRALPFYDLHRLLGAALLVLLIWKYGISRASLRRRLPRGDSSIAAGLATAVVLVGCLGLGLAWTFNVVSPHALWGYSPLNVHVQLGLLLLPLVGWHLLRRWERRSAVADLLGRRNALRLIGLSGAAMLSWRAIERAAALAAPDGSRRPSGSKHVGSFSGNRFPVTIWLFDQVPDVDVLTWRLELAGRVAAPGPLSYDELSALPNCELTTILDCTGGWWSEQVWAGASIGDLLAARGVDDAARWAHVISVTGHRWTFPLEELRHALLATHVGGEVLSPGHGYPVRLVAPGRRGFQWVKWVDRIEIA
jgi:DMSO/TMAO reductase YedYZ molybdopterin-dependent catalytic subunit